MHEVTEMGAKKGLFSKRVFASSLILAALLPVLVVGAAIRSSLRVDTVADEQEIMRVWVEPAKVKLKPGEKIKLKILAEYLHPTEFITSLKFSLTETEGLGSTQSVFNYMQPFAGRVVVGETEVTGVGSGTYYLGPDKQTIITDKQSLSVDTSPSVITVE